jgi:hypothetical protein
MSVSFPAAAEERTVIDAAYISVVASSFRRENLARRLVELFQVIRSSPFE